MGDVVSFGEARAVAERNAKLWTVLDALKSCVREIESGEINPDMVFIALRTPVKDEPHTFEYPSYTAGTNTLECYGLLSLHLKQL